ncbi:MAG: VCBS repeat-containing protein [Saprospiraceae bacterium]|nr:VCBS repeat-containing protein [Saprospiraceae bacterium]
MNYLKLSFGLAFLLGTSWLTAQISFTKQHQLLPAGSHFSGVAVGIVDMNADGRDDIVRLQQGTNVSILLQGASNAPLTVKAVGPLPTGTESQWGLCLGDVNGDGYGDILTGGFYDGVKIIKSVNNGQSYTTTSLTTPQTFVQGVNFADVNGDSWIDAFVCHDDGVARIFGNNGDGTFTYQPNWINLTTTPTSDNSGNYGSVWCDVDNDNDLDLYIAKCRQGVNSPSDPRRINQLFLNNGDGTYTQDVTNANGLRIGAQSWTADFGDIDNDGDFDCFITNHDVSSQLLENDGTGHFTDISVASGIYNKVQGEPIQGVFADFDNDGFMDILVAGSNQYLFRNNGDKTFSQLDNTFDNNDMESYAIGDMNQDGYVDIYASYAFIYTTPSSIPDALWMNTGSGKNFAGISLRGSGGNRQAVGAKVVLYSDLGVQVKEVRSGQSYGISNSFNMVFGLDTLTSIDSAIVYWPSGAVQHIEPVLNQYLIVNEGNCSLVSPELMVNGPSSICTGDSVQITTIDGFAHYTWNTGDTTQVLTVLQPGDYQLTVTQEGGCTAVSNLVTITGNPDETPTIASAGELTFCQGGSVTLQSSAAASYLWSNGETTQSITVSEPGDYTVAIQGQCETFSSAPVQVVVKSADLPVIVNDTVAVGSTATLIADGPNVIWYETQQDQTPVATGNTLVREDVTANDTVWVSNVAIFDIPNQFVGMVDHQGGATSDNTFNGAIIFDALQPFKLAKTKVYTTKAGVRRIMVQSASGQVIDSVSVNIPVGTTNITLNLDIPVGEDLVLTTDPLVNQASIQSAGPQLRRSNEGVSYPYSIQDIVTLKNSNFSLDRYYYFYNWEVDLPGFECESDRVAAIIYVDSSLVSANEPAWASGLQIFPNPTIDVFSVKMPDNGTTTQAVLRNALGQAVAEQTLAPAQPTEFSTRHLAAGVYWLEMTTKEGAKWQRKVVKQ